MEKHHKFIEIHVPSEQFEAVWTKVGEVAAWENVEVHVVDVSRQAPLEPSKEHPIYNTELVDVVLDEDTKVPRPIVTLAKISAWRTERTNSAVPMRTAGALGALKWRSHDIVLDSFIYKQKIKEPFGDERIEVSGIHAAKLHQLVEGLGAGHYKIHNLGDACIAHLKDIADHLTTD